MNGVVYNGTRRGIHYTIGTIPETRQLAHCFAQVLASNDGYDSLEFEGAKVQTGPSLLKSTCELTKESSIVTHKTPFSLSGLWLKFPTHIWRCYPERFVLQLLHDLAFDLRLGQGDIDSNIRGPNPNLVHVISAFLEQVQLKIGPKSVGIEKHFAR